MQLTNQKGEKLYLLTIVKSNEITMPFTSLVTWDEGMKRFQTFTREQEDDNWSRKLIKWQKTELRLYASMITNQKGWALTILKYSVCNLHIITDLNRGTTNWQEPDAEINPKGMGKLL